MQDNQSIIILGAGLTGLTTAFHLAKQGKKVRILEKSDRIGGQIQTLQKDGFVFETGPNTGSVSHPEVTELFTALSPACELENADENAKHRLVWKGDRFRELPGGLWGGITTSIITWKDKFGILGEPFRPKGTNPDESVAELALRRLGKSYVDYCVDPFISGIYAGDPTRLVTRYALPKLYNLEQNYGSFIRGAIAKAKEPKTERDRLATKKVFSAKGGLSSLTNALADAIGRENITLSVSSMKIQPVENHWQVAYSTLEGEKILQVEKVITTVGAHALPEILPFIDRSEMDKITNLRYARIVQVAVGVKDTRGLGFNAFGGLIPSCEKKDLLGILFPAACFSGRAPEKGMTFSFFIGGIKAERLTELSDKEIENIVVREFHEMLKFPADIEPDMIHIARHAHAIPQYEKSTGERLETIERLQNRYPGLILAGNIRNGISMADRILQAERIAGETMPKASEMHNRRCSDSETYGRQAKPRIVFMGTPEFAVESLRALVEGGCQVVGVVTMPDKPVGKHQSVLQASPVKEYALSQNLPLLQPEKLKDPDFIKQLEAWKADLQIVVAFRMLPEIVWNMPPLGTFNLHASLLPQYRGAAPINWAIINGEKETGVTTFFLTHEIDTGKIIFRERIPIHDTDNAEIIHDQLMQTGAKLVLKTVDAIISNEVHPVEQTATDEEILKPAPKIFKETCQIDWHKSTWEVYDFIRGLSPYPAAWTELKTLQGETLILKIFETLKILKPHNLTPGTIVTDGKTQLDITTSDGFIQIKNLQQSGKKRMPVEDFLRGNARLFV